MTDSKAMTFCSPVNFRAKSCIINILVVTVSFSIFWLEILANSMIPVNRNEGGRGGGYQRSHARPSSNATNATETDRAENYLSQQQWSQSNLYNCQSSVF